MEIDINITELQMKDISLSFLEKIKKSIEDELYTGIKRNLVYQSHDIEMTLAKRVSSIICEMEDQFGASPFLFFKYLFNELEAAGEIHFGGLSDTVIANTFDEDGEIAEQDHIEAKHTCFHQRIDQEQMRLGNMPEEYFGFYTDFKGLDNRGYEVRFEFMPGKKGAK